MIGMIEFQAMGCRINVQLETDDKHAEILHRIPHEVAQIETCLTRFNPSSELMQLNAHAGEWVTVSDVLFENIRIAKQSALLTDGLYHPLVLPAMIANGYDRSFDQLEVTDAQVAIPALDWRAIKTHHATRTVQIPVGSALDLGGIAKGWTANYLADKLDEHGACLVNMGGDIVGRGSPKTGWCIEIEDPFTGNAFATLNLQDCSIVTSGIDYRQWQDRQGNHHHHIIDPRTGESAQTDVLSVTIIHPHSPTAEAFAKAVILRGAKAGLEWLNQQWHTAGIVFQKDGAVLATDYFTDLIIERNYVL